MINNKNEYILLPRCLLEEWWNKPEVLRLYIYLLKVAEKGQVVTSVKKLVESLKISTQQVRTALQRLQDNKQINKQTTNKLTIITISNFVSYEDLQQANQQANQQTNNKQIIKNNNNKNFNINNNKHKNNVISNIQQSSTNEQQTNGSNPTTLYNNIYNIDNNINIKNRDKNFEKNLFSETEQNFDFVTTETEEKRKIAPKEKRKIFKPPTVEEVAAYIAEKGYHVNAEEFVNFYESKDWYVGKNKMKNWKSAVALWESRLKQQNYNYGNYTNRQNNGTTRVASIEPRADIDPDEF